MAKTIIYPAALGYLSDIAETNARVAAMGIELDITTAKTIATESNEMLAAVARLGKACAREDFASTDEHMQFAPRISVV